ncbi:FAD-dependent oxidoreductase [Aliiglaciecola sp. 2_MG-2023]|uniref:FAD-dependent oxidoreductase n=1 Tax=unclassified Aliiglaciecola TaxID=2593648 RepID=UPI0026E3C28F|nr:MULTISPECIES: FAD-dependent oxidoreductase [unclassified Aliiglaciecola]MDO6709375.1 FAD-dependent oxidoreductase [Aliiglaciecola sp. 2_MG-2023]MDO6750523.1 FAD-dependent oxidoreductase [Aliiglaciecola sp. 1_MG-2023]
MVSNYYILGAGVTGLSLAYELLKKNQRVTLIEKASSVGGLAKSLTWRNRQIDLGPHIYHTPDKDIEEYWQQEFPSLFYERHHWSKNLKDGNFYDYPVNKEFINNLPKEIGDKIRYELDNVDHDKIVKAKNYYEYIRELAGETLQEMFFIRYPEKLWGMSVKDLDANWAPKRIKIREKSGPFFEGQWSAVGTEGSGTILEELKNKVIALGGQFLLDEQIERLSIKNNRINNISTTKRNQAVNDDDIVINTTSYCTVSEFLGHQTELKYRGVTLVYLAVETANILPNGVDFIYVDDPKILFNRISDQNSFVKKPDPSSTILCFEITYSLKDSVDLMNEKQLTEQVIKQFMSLNLISDKALILDSKIVKLPEVYPMFFLGYENALAKTKAKIDAIENLYTLGSLAEYAYADLQVLFSKAIDLAEILTDSTFKLNQIDKARPRLNFNPKVKLGNEWVGNGQSTYVIAEIGLNHNGNFTLAKELIDKAILAGVNAVKLQSYKSHLRIAIEGKTSRYVEKVLNTQETDYEMFKKSELSPDQTKELFEYAKLKGISLFSTPFDLESVDELEKLGVDCYKIASFDLVNLALIKKVAKTGKPLVISTGMATLSDIESALTTVAYTGNRNVILLHCTSSYPCPPASMNLKAIDTLKQAFNHLPVGLSDHVIGEVVTLAAVSRGANIIEKHFTMDKRMEGPDHVLSLEPKELKNMVSNIRLIEEALGDGIKQPAPDEISTLIRFRKTMYSSVAIKVGETIESKHIVYKGPAYGLYAKFEDIVIGSKAKVNIPKDTPISWDLIRS